MLFFFIGMRIRIKEENGEKLITKQIPLYFWIILDLLMFIISINMKDNTSTFVGIAHSIINILLHIVGVIMAWQSLQYIATLIPYHKSRFFMTVATCSIPIYLFHQQLIYFTIIKFNGRLLPWLHVVINFFFALTFSLLISKVLMRWHVTRLLIGEK